MTEFVELYAMTDAYKQKSDAKIECEKRRQEDANRIMEEEGKLRRAKMKVMNQEARIRFIKRSNL